MGPNIMIISDIIRFLIEINANYVDLRQVQPIAQLQNKQKNHL